MGYSRDSFYRFKKLYDVGGEAALQELTQKKPLLANRTPPEVEALIVELSLNKPTFGQIRIADEVCQLGHSISPAGVRGVWQRHGIETTQKRLAAAESQAGRDEQVATTDKTFANGKAARRAYREGMRKPATDWSASGFITPTGKAAERTEETIGSQTDAALDLIRSSIIDLAIPPGSRIDENLLLNDFRLGRTPAREAINRLVAEGLVNIMPNRGGTFVRKLDLSEISEILVAQQVTENILGQLYRFDDRTLVRDLETIQVAYREVVRDRRYLDITALNEQFHMRINRSLSNSFVYDFAQSIHRHIRRLLVYLYRLEAAEADLQEDAFEINLVEHDKIIEAIARKDRATLTALLAEHARTTQSRFVRIFERKRIEPFMLNIEAPPWDWPGREGSIGNHAGTEQISNEYSKRSGPKRRGRSRPA